jgi:HK97 family phage major capsid protein
MSQELLRVHQELDQLTADLRDIRAKRNADGTFADPLDKVHLEKNNKRFFELTALRTDLMVQQEQEKQAIALEAEAREKGRPATADENTALTYDSAFWRWVVQNPERANLTADEKRMLETRGTSILVSNTDSLGGYTVPQSFSNTLEVMMKHYGGWSAFGDMPDTIGGTLKYPTLDDTASTGNIPGQGTASTVLDLTFGNVLFTDYTVDSKIIKIAEELMQDNRVGLVQSIMTDIIPRRLGTAINTLLTTGTGTNQPYGLTTTVTNSALTTAGATAITQAELLRVVYSVDRAYRDNASWMMNDTILGYIRTLEIGNTNTIPIFTPNGDVVGQEPIRLFGYPIYINNDLAAANGTTRVPVTGTKSLYFGDMSKYKVRRIGGINMSRNDMLYWAERTVGFRAFQRIDGNLINANAIKYLLQA